ncbi:hypothetical protein [Wenyingzhuangia sp. IMCC45574]
MKKYILTLVLLICYVAHSQNSNNLEFKEFDTQKYSKSNTEIRFAKKINNNKYLVIRKTIQTFTTHPRDKYYIEVYNRNGKLIQQKKIKHAPFDKIWVRNDSLFLLNGKKQFYTTGKKRHLGIYVSATAINNLEFKSTKLYDFSSSEAFNDFNSFFLKNTSSLNYNFKVSKTGKYLAILFKCETNKKIYSSSDEYLFSNSFFAKSTRRTYSNAYKVALLQNNTLKEVYSQNFVLNHGASWADINDLKINEFNADISFIETENIKKENLLNSIVDDIKGYKLVTKNVVLINQNGISRVNIGKLNDQYYLGGFSIFYHQQKMFLIGGYANDLKRRHYKGFFKIELNKNLKTIESSYLPFTDRFMKDREKILKMDNKDSYGAHEFNILSPVNVFFTNSGECIINMKEYKSNFNYNRKAPGKYFGIIGMDTRIKRSMTTVMIAAKISTENKLSWARCIYSSNKTNTLFIDDYFSSYRDHKNYFIFNQKEAIVNYLSGEETSSALMTRNRNVKTYFITINEFGEILYKPFSYPINTAKFTYFSSNTPTEGTYNNIMYFDIKKGKKSKSLMQLTF